MVKLVLSVKVSRWLKVYLYTLILLCRILGATPNYRKVNRWIAKGVRFEVAKG